MRAFLIAVLCCFALINCNEQKKHKTSPITSRAKGNRLNKKPIVPPKDKEEDNFVLTTNTAIPFFFKYAKTHKEKKVRIIVSGYGNIDIILYDKTPYHRANFIYLAKKHYFDGTCFHRVVKGFIIQGGNSDTYAIRNKRVKIGRYLLPPDVDKGFKHDRGTISMPSSDIDNPFQMASPYEFFIVQQNPGAYHLDGKYTAFGKVVKGMGVVDKINAIETDNRDWPKQNIIIKSVKILD